jgi:pyrimidine deaminase RibD-like protein
MDTNATDEREIHFSFLRLALDEARKCIPIPTAFSVGAVLTICHPEHKRPVVLATGYSRELQGNTHAEANALTKARRLTLPELQRLLPDIPLQTTVDELLSKADIYTTMEPCSVRTSGLAPCADAIIAAGIRRCFIGVGEPDDFVNCEGANKLKDAGVAVIWLSGLEEKCLEAARAGH